MIGGPDAPLGGRVRLWTRRRARSPHALQLTARTIAGVSRGDVLVARLWARAIQTWEGERVAQTEVVFEEASGRHAKSVERVVLLDGRWQEVQVPFVALGSHRAGQAQLCLRAGYSPQVIEIAGLTLTRPGGRPHLASMPGSLLTYDGRSPNAPWRKEAHARIERLRKADVLVRVTDTRGRPRAGVAVDLRLRRHAFGFGTAVDAQVLLDPRQHRYRTLVEDLFGVAVLENDLKWPQWEGPGRARAEQALEWLAGRGITVRGHTLVWPGWGRMPADVRRLSRDPVRLAARIRDHVTSQASALRGRVAHWDVVNEPCAEREVLAVVGEEAMVEWLARARAADPRALLFVNEDGILTRGGLDADRQRCYAGTIRRLLARSAPIDGIGIQAHFGAQLTGPERVIAVLDRFAALGRPIVCTELDVTVDDPRLQADYLADVTTALFSHPAVTGIVLWGFWEGRHHSPGAALFRLDWTPTPAGRAWLDLVRGRFSTRLAGRTGPDGTWGGRGYLGEYVVTVGRTGGERVEALVLGAGGARLSVVFEGVGEGGPSRH